MFLKHKQSSKDPWHGVSSAGRKPFCIFCCSYLSRVSKLLWTACWISSTIVKQPRSLSSRVVLDSKLLALAFSHMIFLCLLLKPTSSCPWWLSPTLRGYPHFYFHLLQVRLAGTLVWHISILSTRCRLHDKRVCTEFSLFLLSFLFHFLDRGVALRIAIKTIAVLFFFSSFCCCPVLSSTPPFIVADFQPFIISVLLTLGRPGSVKEETGTHVSSWLPPSSPCSCILTSRYCLYFLRKRYFAFPLQRYSSCLYWP